MALVITEESDRALMDPDLLALLTLNILLAFPLPFPAPVEMAPS